MARNDSTGTAIVRSVQERIRNQAERAQSMMAVRRRQPRPAAIMPKRINTAAEWERAFNAAVTRYKLDADQAAEVWSCRQLWQDDRTGHELEAMTIAVARGVTMPTARAEVRRTMPELHRAWVNEDDKLPARVGGRINPSNQPSESAKTGASGMTTQMNNKPHPFTIAVDKLMEEEPGMSLTEAQRRVAKADQKVYDDWRDTFRSHATPTGHGDGSLEGAMAKAAAIRERVQAIRARRRVRR